MSLQVYLPFWIKTDFSKNIFLKPITSKMCCLQRSCSYFSQGVLPGLPALESWDRERGCLLQCWLSIVCVLSHVWIFATLWTITQAPGPLCPWDFPGRNTEVGCPSLLWGIFPTQELNPNLLPWQADSLSPSHVGSQNWKEVDGRLGNQHFKQVSRVILFRVWELHLSKIRRSINSC